MGLHRIFVEEKSYKRLKNAKERHGKDMHDFEWEAVESLLDEEGRYKKVALKDETLQPLLEWANEIGVSPEELILMLTSCVRTLFDPNLSLADALRSIPSLAKDLGITKAKGKPPK